jgi:hypothetical protein
MRDVVRGLALAMVVALVVGAGLAAVVARDQGYWTAGYYRLVVAVVRTRFDLLAPAAAVLALVWAALASWRRRRRGGVPPRVGVATVALACVLAFRVGTALEARHAPSGPNLLLISIDTLRADRLGAYGYPLPTSPTIDARLAAEGVTFTDVYSQSPKTTPSHMTLLTSLYPSVHGVELWENDAPGHVLNPAVHTLAEVLKNAGYATAAFTGGAQMDHSRGFDAGFDVYVEHGQKRRALKWLGRHAREPFFLFYHTYDVHDPYLPPDEYVRLFAPDYRGACSTPSTACARRTARARRRGWVSRRASGRTSTRTTRARSSSSRASTTPVSAAWTRSPSAPSSSGSTSSTSPATRSSCSRRTTARRSASTAASSTVTSTARRCTCRSSSASRAVCRRAAGSHPACVSST